ncbi:MAG: spermidine synthase, partial [Acidimicrobiales bacterium]
RVPMAAGALAVVGLAIAVFPSNRGLWAYLHSATDLPFVLVEERACVNALVERNGAELLYINATSQNGYPYDAFHVLIGLVPALVHPAPARAMAVGLGAGGTTYAMAADRRMQVVDTVEICGGEIDLIRSLADRGSPESRLLLTDPRVRLRVGDGRKFLLDAERGYDVITVDTLRPQSGYSGNLYSAEFYELVRSRLAEGGLFAQWVPTARSLTTVRTVFPHVTVLWVGGYGGSRFLLASSQPITFDRAAVNARLAAMGADATFGGVLGPALTGYLATVGPSALPPQGRVPAGQVNRDLFPRDEYFLNQD